MAMISGGRVMKPRLKAAKKAAIKATTPPITPPSKPEPTFLPTSELSLSPSSPGLGLLGLDVVVSTVYVSTVVFTALI